MPPQPHVLPSQQLSAEELEVQAEEDFRQNLREVIIIVKKMSPLCKSVEELIELADFATKNDASLRMLIERVSPLRMRP